MEAVCEQEPLKAITVEPVINIGTHQYFTVESIANAFGLKRYNIINIVREGHLHGRKIGKEYVIDAQEFNDFIKSGFFEKQQYNKTDEDDELEAG